MSSSPFARGTRNEPTAVVVDFDPAPNPGLPALEVYGAVDGARVQDALDGIALRDPAAAAWCPVLTAHGPEHHSLRFTSGVGAAPRDFPLGLLADLLTRPGTVGVPPARRIASTPLQRELLADADAHPGTGRQVEQLAWDWHGPLDPERFTSAWQSVVARESVLRTAFDDGPEPATVIHDRIDAEVQRLPCTPAAWPALLERDRRRGLDPRRPGPLRITVLDTQATPARHRDPAGCSSPTITPCSTRSVCACCCARSAGPISPTADCRAGNAAPTWATTCAGSPVRTPPPLTTSSPAACPATMVPWSGRSSSPMPHNLLPVQTGSPAMSPNRLPKPRGSPDGRPPDRARSHSPSG